MPAPATPNLRVGSTRQKCRLRKPLSPGPWRKTPVEARDTALRVGTAYYPATFGLATAAPNSSNPVNGTGGPPRGSIGVEGNLLTPARAQTE
jgi:hypothetical protein